AAYSTYCQVVIAIFMVLFGVNFNIYFLILTGNIRRALKSEEMHVYFGILFATTAVIAVNVISYFKNIWEAIHHSFFTVSSIITTTGFATVDFNTWPQFTHYILLFLMVIGGSSGSTAGGIKVIRSMIVTKGAMHSFRSMLHNRRVKVITIDGKAIDESVVSKVNVYLNIYVVLSAISLLILSLDAISFEESFSSVIACINNVGPGFGRMGAVGNYSTLSNVSKLTLSVDMLLGRLEIYPIIMLFMPSMWRRTG
ncbi:MAG TPA: potassium transporter TrkG, partial [Bacillota bacterium]|nr:potassium transporter TrkG [Bacillota bacterium]